MGAPNDIRCGPFRLHEPIGAGGTGLVYRAEHIRDGTQCALKVLVSEKARQPEYWSWLRREVRALARLNHPGFATIYDYGVVGEGEEDDTPAALVDGAPWYAMEHVEGQPLLDVARAWSWQEILEFALATLDALAHAHANDVIHRDLSPANLIVPENHRSVCIVDFGFAHVQGDIDAESDDDGSDQIGGTPEYMAPEQIRGDWRAQGPWTDLYALGCLIWWIVCREFPFSGETKKETMRAHLDESAPPFRPEVDAPRGLRQWLTRLLAKSPADRFQFAADAAWQLLALAPNRDTPSSDEPSIETLGGTASGPTLSTIEVAPSEDISTVELVPTAEGPTDTWLEDPSNMPETVEKSLETTRRPIPTEWRRKRTGETRPLSASGLELFSFRRLPVVDREHERDILWEILHETARSRTPNAVLLEGRAGSGKSKLAEWLLRRAEEVGAAVGMTAYHTRVGGPRDGLGPMFGRFFRLQGLPKRKAVGRLMEDLVELGLDETTALFDADGLCELAGLADAGQPMGGGFQGRRERHLTFQRVLSGLGQSRPVLLWLDDIPWGRESLKFAEFLMNQKTDEDLPVLTVMTARRGEIHERPEIRRTLDAMLPPSDRRRIEVEPLDSAHQREMIERMLDFTPQLTDELVERTEGHPLFAVQLVNDWVDRGVLRMTDNGFTLPDFRHESLPADVLQLWKRRVDEFLNRYPEPQREDSARALELGAVLGRHVIQREWKEVLRELDIVLPEGFEESLVHAGLFEPTDRGLRFAHGLLVDAIEAQAEQHNRLDDNHRICARSLQFLYSDQRTETASRRAEHWLKAGDPEHALEPLLRASRDASKLASYQEQAEFLEKREELMNRIGVPEEDKKRVENWIAYGSNLGNRGDIEQARSYLERARRVAEKHGWDDSFARSSLGIGYLLEVIGDGERAAEAIDRAEAAFQREGSRIGRARCLIHRARVQWRLFQQFEDARATDQRAQQMFRDLDAPHGLLRCQADLCWIALALGESEWAEKSAQQLLRQADEHRTRYLRGRAWNILGKSAHEQRNLDEARRRYHESERVHGACGSKDAALARLNSLVVELDAGNYEYAADELRDLAPRLQQAGFRTRLPLIHLGLVVCAGAEARWEAWDREARKARQNLSSHDYRFADQARLAELAADHATSNDGPGRARELYGLAARLWDQLHADEDRRRVEKKRRQL